MSSLDALARRSGSAGRARGEDARGAVGRANRTEFPMAKRRVAGLWAERLCACCLPRAYPRSEIRDSEEVVFPQRLENVGGTWCRRAGLNCRPQPYQGCALPLSYGGGSLRKRPYSQRFRPGQAKNARLIKIFARGLLPSWISRPKTQTRRALTSPRPLPPAPQPWPRPSARRVWRPPCGRICAVERRRARAARGRRAKATESHPSCDVTAFRGRRSAC